MIAEDQALVRDALARLLAREPDIEVVGQAADGRAAVRLAHALTPDVTLLDIEMPEQDGISACREIRERHPEMRLVVLTTFGRPGYLRRALDAGADGFLLKDDPVDVLAANLRRIQAGERMVDPALAVTALTGGPCPLSDRELEVLAMAADGSPVGSVAQALYLSEGTVRNYLSAIIQKLAVKNRAQAVLKARDSGWI